MATSQSAALRTIAIRLLLFYVLALAVVAAVIPWTQTGGSVAVAESPFVKVLALTGIPHAAGIMNFVIISAALSGMNTNVYLCARMMFSLARGRYAPSYLGKLSASGSVLFQRLLCRYPYMGRFIKGDNPTLASSWTCVEGPTGVPLEGYPLRDPFDSRYHEISP